MSDQRIGQYVRRHRNGDWTTLPHLVESVIDDEPVTRCGRRLRAIEGTGFQYRFGFATRTCQGCT